MITREQIEELRERSKDDRAIIVGSEVRMLCDAALRATEPAPDSELVKRLNDIADEADHAPTPPMLSIVPHLRSRPDHVGVEDMVVLAKDYFALSEWTRTLLQAVFDPENQTSQFGTVLLSALQSEREKDGARYIGALKDAERLDWLEQQSTHGLIIDIVADWTYDGRRYGTGMRDAIDAAMRAK